MNLYRQIEIDVRKNVIKPLVAGVFTVALLALPPQAAERSQIRFENHQKLSRVDFILNNSTTDDKPVIDSVLGGVALLDYDNDGYLDIFFNNGARTPALGKDSPDFSNRLYHNNHDGTFTDVTDRAGVKGYGYSVGVAVADFDNDGFPDIYVTGVNRNTLYHNNGDGTFTDVTERAGVAGIGPNGKKLWSVSAAWIDYDNDGRLDLFVSNYLDWTFETSKVCGPPGRRLSCSPTMYKGEPNFLYHNNGDGTFTDVSAATGIAEHIGKGMGVAIADYNGDGWMDIFVANDKERKFLFTANSHVSDNADDDHQQHYRQANAVFQNLQDGTFRDVSRQAGPDMQVRAAHRGCAFGDLNNDGKIDVVVSAIGDHAELLCNTTTNNNHWILLQTIGVKSNRDGIGTRIKVTGESGLVQYNHVTTAGSFASSSDKRVHFGLGRDTRIKEIELRWTSGRVQVLRNVKVDQILKITESEK